jgi:LysR family transcriptional regulator for metE and metH
MAGASREPLQSLSNRHIDLAIMSGEVARPGATAVPLFDDHQLFIMAPSHALASRQFVEVSEISTEELISYSKAPGTDREVGQMLRAGDASKARSVTVEIPEVIVELVAAGQGTSVLAGWSVESAVRAGRIRAARISHEGVVASWSAVIRSEDNEPGNPIRTVASLLSNWCLRTGHGFRPAPD